MMVNWQSTKIRLAAFCAAVVILLGLAGTVFPNWMAEPGGFSARADQPAPLVQPAILPSPAAAVIVQPPAVDDVLRSGVLIVVSKASQRMYVFKNGSAWRSSPVSTGRRGHTTPSGVFPILQKKVFHRSNIYSNAPMPYMQRLTWSGIAIHAGHLPGYPASHGCIRVPREFARALYGLTRSSATTVVVASEPLKSDRHAQTFALNLQVPPTIKAVPAPLQPAAELASHATPPSAPTPILPYAPVDTPAARPASGQTIQLAASASMAEAEAHWTLLTRQRPELGGFQKAVIPAVVGSRRVYRLRVTAPAAHAYCSTLKSAGIACFNVS